MHWNQVMTTMALGGAILIPFAAFAGQHTWRVNEVFSNSDETIQFIELRECCGNPSEVFIGGNSVSSTSTGLNFIFPANLGCVNCTAGAHLLLATQGFADLPGAPTPDYIIADNFFSTVGDTIEYDVWDSLIHTGIPTDGLSSMQGDGSLTNNSPTNLNGDSATLIVRCHPADIDLSGAVNVTDLLALLASWGTCVGACPSDISPDREVNVTDLLLLLSGWGTCP